MHSTRMIVRISFNRLVTLALLIALCLSLSLPVSAQPLPGQPSVQLDFPVESPGVPAYARLELLIPNFDVPNTARWAAIVFYRDPSCVPLDFDLGQFFHLPGPGGLGAFGCELLVEGHEIWANGPGVDLAPIYVRSRNASPTLPIWFVAWQDLEPVLASGQVFIGDIEGLPSLERGTAHWFEEALYPNGAAAVPGITIRAEGSLENGGDFQLRWHFVNAGEVDEVMIRLRRKRG